MKYSLFLFLIFGFLFFQESSAQTSSEIDTAFGIQDEKIHSLTEYSASFPGGGFERNKYFYNLIENNRIADLLNILQQNRIISTGN